MKITLNVEDLIRKLTVHEESILATLESTYKGNGKDINEIAEDVDVKLTSTKVAIAKLKFVGWIEVELRGKRHRYYITEVGRVILNEMLDVYN